MAPFSGDVCHKKKERQKLLDLSENDATRREGQRQNEGTDKAKKV
jgi:hypothetical protein